MDRRMDRRTTVKQNAPDLSIPGHKITKLDQLFVLQIGYKIKEKETVTSGSNWFNH